MATEQQEIDDQGHQEMDGPLPDLWTPIAVDVLQVRESCIMHVVLM